MAYDKVVDSDFLEAGLKKVGDSIRAKAGTSELFEFPDAMAAAVTNLGFSVNGVTKQLRATADINKGDFVQLTDYGIEIPTFDELASWEQGTSGRNGVSVAVVDHDLIAWAYIQFTGSFATSSTKNLYVQCAQYSGDAWVTSEPVLVHTVTTTYCDVSIARGWYGGFGLCFAADTPKTASLFGGKIKRISANNVLPVVTMYNSAVDAIAMQRTRYTPVMIIGVPSNTVHYRFVAFIPRDNATQSGLTAVCFRIDVIRNTIQINSTLDIYTGSTSEDGKTYICMLSEEAILISSTKGGALSYNSSAAHLQVLNIPNYQAAADADMTLTAPTLKGYPGPIVQLSDNLVVHCSVAAGKDCEYLQYDPETETLTATPIVTMTGLYVFDMVRIGESKLCALVDTGTAPTLYSVAIIDIANGTFKTLETPIDGTGHISTITVRRLSSGYGLYNEDDIDWLGIVNGVTGILVTPASIMHTVGPYVDTIGGVALADGVQGEKMPVVMPGRTES